jgi:hypothetical protein
MLLRRVLATSCVVLAGCGWLKGEDDDDEPSRRERCRNACEAIITCFEADMSGGSNDTQDDIDDCTMGCAQDRSSDQLVDCILGADSCNEISEVCTGGFGSGY